MDRPLRPYLLASVAVGGLLLASPALSAAARDAAAASTSSTEIGELIVTAQKRSQSVQTVPAAITAIGGASLDQRGIVNTGDLQFAVPSFHAGTLTGATGITIRGVGATTVGTTGTSGVAVNIDGVYQTTTETVDIAQVDLDRVEVLRGPQGTLYGRNATGGAVNFITNAPAHEFGGYLLAGFAQYDEYHLRGVLNVPLGDQVRTRLVVDYRDREDGFVKNILPGGEDVDKGKTLLGRFRLDADLTPAVNFDLGLAAMHSTGPWQYLTNYSTPAPIAFTVNPFLTNATFISTPWRTDVNDPVGGTRDYESVSGTFTVRLPFNATLKSITAFQSYMYTYANDGDGTNLSIAPYRGRTRDQALTQEFDLSGAVRRLDWVVGAFYLDEHNFSSLHYDFSLGLSGLPPGSTLDFEQPTYDTTSYAAFGDVTYHLTDKLKLIAGARYSEDRQKAVYSTLAVFNFGGVHVPVPFCPQETDNLKYDSFTPRAGVQYDFTPDLNAYFTYSRGFKAGGANIYSCQDDYTPEKITAYEGGFKSRWLHNTVTFNVSAFYYDYSDFQVSQIVGLATDITNAGAAEVKGVELEGAWAVDSHWTLNANYSYIDARYSNFSNTDGLNPQLGLQNLDGHLLDNSPLSSANAGIAYRTDPFDWGRLTFRVDASYRSRTFFREFNDLLDSQAPYGLVNLNAIWDSANGKYEARLYATNVAGQAYVQALGDSTDIGTRYVTWGAPRQVGGEIKVRF